MTFVYGFDMDIEITYKPWRELSSVENEAFSATLSVGRHVDKLLDVMN